MRSGQVIFTYFHFAASEELTGAVLNSGAVAIAYETVELDSGELPLLTPMSEVAGRMAVQEGAKYLEKPQGDLACCWVGFLGLSLEGYLSWVEEWLEPTQQRWQPGWVPR